MKSAQPRHVSRVLLLLLLSLLFSFLLAVPGQAGDNGDVTVFVTNTGERYHRYGCSYLKSSRAISLADAVEKGYTPCSRCDPPVLGISSGSDFSTYDVPETSGGVSYSAPSFSGGPKVSSSSSSASHDYDDHLSFKSVLPDLTEFIINVLINFSPFIIIFLLGDLYSSKNTSLPRKYVDFILLLLIISLVVTNLTGVFE